MKRNPFLTRALFWVLALTMVPYGAFAQDEGGTAGFSQQELDQMLAPIALYPDSLLAQVLIAATYPDQVTEADRWIKANPDLKGEALNGALDGMGWDLSVKALAPFPQVLTMMADEAAWTQRLGEAFLGQQADVMDSVQKLRAKAQAAGNLKTTAEQRVVVKGEEIEIEPVAPEVVYVPRYDPMVVYGSWWWPTYPPYAYYPVWPGVALGIGVGFGFWGAVSVGPAWGWGWGSWGWGSRNVNINVNRTVNINSRTASFTRNSVRTTSFHQAAVAGRVGSSQTRAAAFNRTGAGRTGMGSTGAGRTGVTGRGAGGARPSSSSVMQGLKGGGSRGTAGGGGRATGNVTRGGTGTGGAGGGGRNTGNLNRNRSTGTGSAGGGGRATGNVSRGGTGTGGAGGGGRNTGNVSRNRGAGGGGAGGGGAGRASGNISRGAGGAGRSPANMSRGGGGARGGGAPRGGGGGAARGGGGAAKRK